MTDAFVEDFLVSFDDSRYPTEFLQRYELMECLSYNEIGETLLVKDRQSGDCYVAKCYLGEFSHSQPPESDLLKDFHHPGLPVYAGEYQNGTMRCIVREYAPGRSLERLARESHLTRQQAVDIAVQLCEILSYLHEQTPAIIHRDIKPQNVVVDDQGKVTLIDFGISRRYDDLAQQDTYCFGTRHYAAPEQYGFSQTDSRSDIYSLGVLLCWLFTGETDVRRAKEKISEGRLARIIDRCTAFAPKDRYRHASEVRDALTGRTHRRNLLILVVAALVVFAAGILILKPGQFLLPEPAGVSFSEPLIEQAVRLALEKDATEPLTEQDLLSVTEVFVFGNQPAANEEMFNVHLDHFVHNDGAVLRGDITDLNDLTRLQNLRRVTLSYQNIVDLSPLAELTSLETVDVRHNPVNDVSPLAGLVTLTSLTVFDTNVSDFTSLSACSRLDTLDAGYTLIRSTAVFSGLPSLRTLSVRKAPLQSLDQIETLPTLERIYLSETQVLDLAPLLNLPRLQTVEVDASMRQSAEAIVDRAHFEIVYQ